MQYNVPFVVRTTDMQDTILQIHIVTSDLAWQLCTCDVDGANLVCMQGESMKENSRSIGLRL